ncbi:hypothetical protein D3C75_1201170 [compost metagenome]
MGDLVEAFALQAAFGVEFGQAGGGGLDVSEGHRQAVLCFTGSAHRQPGVVGGGALGGFFRGFYGGHSVCSCRRLAARHTDNSANERRAKVCRAAHKRSIQGVMFLVL